MQNNATEKSRMQQQIRTSLLRLLLLLFFKRPSILPAGLSNYCLPPPAEPYEQPWFAVTESRSISSNPWLPKFYHLSAYTDSTKERSLQLRRFAGREKKSSSPNITKPLYTHTHGGSCSSNRTPPLHTAPKSSSAGNEISAIANSTLGEARKPRLTISRARAKEYP